MSAFPSPHVIRKLAVELVSDFLTRAGYRVELAPPGSLADLVANRRSRGSLVKVLAATAPHHRGGKGSLGLHWMLGETAAELVALVDLSRRRVWLLPIVDFRSQAKPAAGGRHHLDWIVVPAGKRPSAVPAEEDFASFALH